MRELPTGTVTLLFTDIEGSTRLLQQLGDRYASLLETCRYLLRASFLEFHGHEVDTQGDAFFVAFARASDAVAAAVAVQHALASHVWPEGMMVRVRMGLHTGEPSLVTEGLVGLDVHRAARIMSAGYGGQEIKDFLKRGAAKRLHLKQLPGYTPDLNPDEGIWNYLKRVELGNVCCSDLDQLQCELIRARERLRHKKEIIQSCSRQGGYSV